MYTKNFTTTIVATLAVLATQVLSAPSSPSALDTRHLSDASSGQTLNARQVYTGSCTATNCGAQGTNCRASGKWCTPFPNSSAPQGCVCSSL